jgi:hypothetical protein
MSKINPVHKQFTLEKPIVEAKQNIITKLLQLKGKVVLNDETQIECEFGSHLKSKLLGELFVSGETLPKKAVINFSERKNSSTHISVHITDTHKYGFKAGLVKKYEQALQELSNSITIGFE